MEMEALYAALVNGEHVYNEDGTHTTRAPTALHLRAARTIKQLSEINNMNQHVNNQLQQQVNQHLFDIQTLNETIYALRNPETVPASDSINNDEPATETTPD